MRKKGDLIILTCPVCFYDKLEEPAADYNICECCGTEFENDDCDTSHDELRDAWVRNGAQWFFGNAPAGWNPWTQLFKANAPIPFASVGFSGGQEMHQVAERINVQSQTREAEQALAYAS